MNPVFVIGHRNPDTDSICSAICYANLKQITSGGEYVPGRAGHVNSETQFVLDYFGMAALAWSRRATSSRLSRA